MRKVQQLVCGYTLPKFKMVNRFINKEKVDEEMGIYRVVTSALKRLVLSMCRRGYACISGREVGGGPDHGRIPR